MKIQARIVKFYNFQFSPQKLNFDDCNFVVVEGENMKQPKNTRNYGMFLMLYFFFAP